MIRTAVRLFLTGLFVAVLATVQFVVQSILSDNPDRTPALPQLLLWGGWAFGGVLAAAGIALGLVRYPTYPR